MDIIFKFIIFFGKPTTRLARLDLLSPFVDLVLSCLSCNEQLGNHVLKQIGAHALVPASGVDSLSPSLLPSISFFF